MYQEAYCFRCRNFGRDSLSKTSEVEGCPIWDLHLFYAYEETGSDSNAEKMLDYLIPRVDHTFQDGTTHKINGECVMFWAKPGLEIPGQLSLEEV